jgi:ADP-ribose pyrophosphatase YjhB (NUDIX family)
MPYIRALAICVFCQADRILVVEDRDSVKGETFYRPLGGGIEFGETGACAVSREIREEIGAEVRELQYLGTLENIFTYNGAPGHELVQVYRGRFADASLYSRDSISGVESNGTPMAVLWKALDFFSPSRPLYPTGLLELIGGSPCHA